MKQTNINNASIKQLSDFIVQKHFKDEMHSFNYNQFSALRFYQSTSKDVEKCMYDKFGINRPQNQVIQMNAGNITFDQINNTSTLTTSSANIQCIAVNKIGIDSAQINSFIEELEKYIGDNYWLVNGVCKEITQSSECPAALQIAEISSHITSFLICDNPPLSFEQTQASVEISGENTENNISE